MSLQQLNSNFKNLPRHFSNEFEGKWTAILDGKVVLSDDNFKQVFKQATTQGISRKVLFHRVPKKEIIIV